MIMDYNPPAISAVLPGVIATDGSDVFRIEAGGVYSC
jgi:hypothetical protein